MKLIEWKDANEHSYTDLAKKLGISRSFAYRICQGHNSPGFELRMHIKAVTHGAVSSDDLDAAHALWRALSPREYEPQ